MKSKLRNLLLAAMALTLFAGCSNIALNDAAVEGSDAGDKCMLTISYSDLEGILSESSASANGNARTIDPGKYTEGTNTTFKIKGISVRNTVHNEEEIEFEGSENERKATIALEYDEWKLTLSVYEGTKEILRGVTTVDLRKSNSEKLKFLLSTKDVTTPGSLSLNFKKIESPDVKSYFVGLYNVNTDKLEVTLGDGNISTLTYNNEYLTDPNDENSKVSVFTITNASNAEINPGDYVLKFIGYNDVKPAANAADNRGVLVNWSDIITIAPGRTTTGYIEITGIKQRPSTPINFTASLVDTYKLDKDFELANVDGKKDTSDSYTVELKWDRGELKNEDGFVLRLYESNGTEADLDAILEKDPIAIFDNSKGITGSVPFADSRNNPYYVEGTLGVATTSCKIKLPTGHLYEMTLTAKNAVGESIVSDTQDAQRRSDGADVNTEGNERKGFAAAKRVNLQKITYAVLGGTRTITTTTGSGADAQSSTVTSKENIVDYRIFDTSYALRSFTTDADTLVYNGHPFSGWTQKANSGSAVTGLTDYKDIIVYASYNTDFNFDYEIKDEYKTLTVTAQVSDVTSENIATADTKIVDGKLTIKVTEDNVWAKFVTFTITNLTSAQCEKIILFVNGTMVGAQDNTNTYAFSLNNFRLPETYNITVVGVQDGKNYSFSMPLTVDFTY